MDLDKVREALERHDLPVYQIARKAGIRPGWVYNFKIGVYEPNPNDSRIKKLCKVMGLDNVDEN